MNSDKMKDLPPIADATLWTRRKLLQQASFSAVIMPFTFQQIRGKRMSRAPRIVDPSKIPSYRFRTLSVERFPALQKEYDAARENSRLGQNKTYRAEIAPLQFKLPADFPGAKSVIVVATYAKNMYANFHLDGKTHRILVPYQYYDDGMNGDRLKDIVQKEIIKTPGRRLVNISQQTPLKLLAARSGLGRYARNSLVFVDGMGSYNLLHAFLTDHPFADDTWSSLDILDECNRCHACERTCPTRCINRWNYSVNIDKCLTLFNENPGTFPNFILGSMHHALMGCMQCKAPCPVNEGIAELHGTLEDISEDETRKILSGASDEKLLQSLQLKLREFRAAASREQFPVLQRNLRALIRA